MSLITLVPLYICIRSENWHEGAQARARDAGKMDGGCQGQHS